MAFDLEIEEIIEEAHQYVGGEPILGDEFRDAMRTLRLLLVDWQRS